MQTLGLNGLAFIMSIDNLDAQLQLPDITLATRRNYDFSKKIAPVLNIFACKFLVNSVLLYLI